MSQLFTVPSFEFLIIAGRVIALLAGLSMFAWAFSHWRRAASKDTQRVFEQLDLLRSDLLIMKEVMHHAAHRVDSAVHQVTHETRLSQATSAGAARGYEIAARMARNGSGKDELIKSCGLTSHEAELLIKLHGQRQNAADLIGRQPRSAQPNTATTAARDPAWQSATAQRQAPTAGETSRTVTSAPKPSSSTRMPPRSRLVAVG